MAELPPRGASPRTRALVVDDQRMNRELLVAMLGASGYETVTAEDGEAAWDILDDDPDGFDVVLLDRRMPRLDGIGLTSRIRDDCRLAALPVIMQTALASPEEVAEGIKAGATYYLAKPLNRKVLLSVIASAIDSHTRLRRLRCDIERRNSALGLLQEGVFRFRTIDEGNTLAVALARSGPRPGRLVVGLSEMFTNAVEHGNLGITYAEKEALVADNRWHQEIMVRQARPEYAKRNVLVRLERSGGMMRFTIRDEGDGFDWRSYLNLSPARAFAAHGRGIAIAGRMAFDIIEYIDPGNEVICSVLDPDNADLSPASFVTASASPVDTDLACSMQAELLPTADEMLEAETAYGLRLDSRVEMAHGLGGDLWGLRPIDSTRLALYVADIAGHGLAAALNTFRVHTLFEHLHDLADRPGLMLNALNCQLVTLLPQGQYCAMLYGVLDIKAGSFTYSAAAMPAPMVGDSSSGTIFTGDGSGLPLGLDRLAHYETRTLPMPPGAMLMLVTDGVIENPIAAGAPLRMAGLEKVLGDCLTAGRAAPLDAVLAEIRRPLRDDLAAVLCRRLD